MIEFVLTAAGAHRIRFGLSPLDEPLRAIQVIHGQRRHPTHAPWLASVSAKATQLPIDELVAVLSDEYYTCDFLSPPPVNCARRPAWLHEWRYSRKCIAWSHRPAPAFKSDRNACAR